LKECGQKLILGDTTKMINQMKRNDWIQYLAGAFVISVIAHAAAYFIYLNNLK